MSCFTFSDQLSLLRLNETMYLFIDCDALRCSQIQTIFHTVLVCRHTHAHEHNSITDVMTIRTTYGSICVCCMFWVYYSLKLSTGEFDARTYVRSTCVRSTSQSRDTHIRELEKGKSVTNILSRTRSFPSQYPQFLSMPSPTHSPMFAIEEAVPIPEYVRAFVQCVATRLGYSEAATVHFESGSKIGDGFLGTLVAVTISECGQQPVNLMCKMLPTDHELTVEMNVVQMFKQEVFVYEKVLPIFEQFQRSKGLTTSTGFFAYPKCYGCICNEDTDQFLIVMNDLRMQNYRMWPKQLPVDLQHAKDVICQLAKFHAVSLALNDQQPAVFEPIKSAPDLLQTLLVKPAFVNFLADSQEKMISVLEHSMPEHWQRFRELLDECAPILSEVFDGKSSEPFAVFTHGDCWGNNTMFKYQCVGIFRIL